MRRSYSALRAASMTAEPSQDYVPLKRKRELETELYAKAYRIGHDATRRSFHESR